MLTAAFQVQLEWKGKKLTAHHRSDCSCIATKPGTKYERLHAFRIYGRQGYIFDQYSPWVKRFAMELWSEDDPFAEEVIA